MDIKIDVGFLEHPKTLRLLKRHGYGAITALLTLWTWCANYRPDGDLSGLNDEDINAVSRWKGDLSFAASLFAIGFLDKDENGSYSLHNWKEHQGIE